MERILGVSPAFMRPVSPFRSPEATRSSSVTQPVPFLLSQPYGNYNNLVREAALIRNQSLVLWDFDSGDSTGSTVAQSEAAYTKVAKQHPSNLLALNHETYATTAYVILFTVLRAGPCL